MLHFQISHKSDYPYLTLDSERAYYYYHIVAHPLVHVLFLWRLNDSNASISFQIQIEYIKKTLHLESVITYGYMNVIFI